MRKWSTKIDGLEISAAAIYKLRNQQPPAVGDVDSFLVIESSGVDQTDPRTLLQDTCNLLSIALRKPVRPVAVRTFRNDKVTFSLLMSWGIDSCGLPRLIPNDPSAMEAFFELVWRNFQEKKERWHLKDLIWYYESACVESELEKRFIYGCIFFEALKFFWAKGFSELERNETRDGIIKSFSARKNGRPIDFATLLCMAADYLGVEDRDFTFIENRNSLFHTGLPLDEQDIEPNPRRPLNNEFIKLMGQMDEFLLRILGYHGPYEAIADRFRTRIFPAKEKNRPE